MDIRLCSPFFKKKVDPVLYVLVLIHYSLRVDMTHGLSLGEVLTLRWTYQFFFLHPPLSFLATYLSTIYI
jgi:hypothetical protein